MPDALLVGVATADDPDRSERIPAISLLREPANDAIHGPTAATASLIEPFLASDKKLGLKGCKTH